MLSRVAPHRFLSSPLSSFRTFSTATEPTLSADDLISVLTPLAVSISHDLHTKGYWTNNGIRCNATSSDAASSIATHFTPLIPLSTIAIMRYQAIKLRDNGRYEQSYSEAISATGVATRFDKEGVFACEPDGGDYDVAPDLLVYMSTIISHLPVLLNESSPTSYAISNQAFNAKLAVTSAGGSVYPRHIDNPTGVQGGDTRKLTCIVYLNPEYEAVQRGELRLFLGEGEVVDIEPAGGTIAVFWSDEIPHEVLPTAPTLIGEEFDRYALTIWLPTDDVGVLHCPESKFKSLREQAF